MRRGHSANGLTNEIPVKTVCNSRAVFESFDRWERSLLNRDRIAIIPKAWILTVFQRGCL